jgi:hypothetical protein
MKVKIISPIYSSLEMGTTHEVSLEQVTIVDDMGTHWLLSSGEFEVVQEESSKSTGSIASLIGQDMQSITVDFK